MKKTNKIASYLVACLLVFSSSSIQAQSMGNQTVAMLKESPAGSKVLSFIKAINKGEAVTDDFIKEIMDEDLIAKVGLAGLKNIIENDIPENDGKLTVYKVDRVERYKFMVYAKGSKSNEWIQMDFTHKGEAPYRIVGIGVDIIDGAPEGADKPMKID